MWLQTLDLNVEERSLAMQDTPSNWQRRSIARNSCRSTLIRSILNKGACMESSGEKKLFAVYLGGRADHCNIELHDVVFVVGATIEETYPLLAKKWFGNLKGFHIDSYVELQNID